MANWQKIKSSAKRIAKSAIKGTGEAADIASLHIRLKSLENKRDKEYEALGKLTYRQLKTGISQAEKIAPVVSNIDTVREKIKNVNAAIEEVKQARAERIAGERASRLTEEEEMLNDIAEDANSEDDEDDDE